MLYLIQKISDGLIICCAKKEGANLEMTLLHYLLISVCWESTHGLTGSSVSRSHKVTGWQPGLDLMPALMG